MYAASSRIQATLGLEPEISSLNDLPLTELRRQVEASMEQWNRGEALKQAPAGEVGAAGDGAPAGEREVTPDGRAVPEKAALAPVVPPSIGAMAWNDLNAGQPIGRGVGSVAWTIADIHERSMAQLKRGPLAAVSTPTAR